jgi:hypothetical protein
MSASSALGASGMALASDVGAAGERRATGEHLEQHAAERVDVGAPVDLLALDLLGRHVRGRADDLAGARQLRVAGGGGELGQAEVDELRRLAVLRVRCEQHVGRLEIAMDDARGVGGVEAPAEPLRDGERTLDGQRAELDPVGERLAAHVLHDDEGRIADDEVEEARDVRMLDRSDGLRFVLEALAELGIGEELRPEQLDGHAHADGDVLGDEDFAHAARAERLDQLEAAADHLADDELGASDQLVEAVGQGVDARHPPFCLVTHVGCERLSQRQSAPQSRASRFGSRKVSATETVWVTER